MNKNTKTILLIILVIILGSVAYFSTVNTSATIGKSGPLRNFAYADTSVVTKFSVSDTEGNKITITRENTNNIWMVEGSEFKARPENVKLILDALNRIVVKQDLDEAKINSTLNFLAVRHKKVEFYINGEETPIKTWYIGNSSADHQGTFMLLQEREQKSSIPFIVYKPGMRGSLDSRFFTSFVDWRYTGIYNYAIGNIRKIEFNFIDNPIESYTLNIDKESNIEFLDNSSKIIPIYDTAQLSHYITHYKKLHYSHVVDYLTQAQIDSVLSLTPNLTIDVTDNSGAKKGVKIWKIMDKIETEDGISEKLNASYAYLVINDSKELVRIQYYQWDNVLKPKSYFLPKPKQ